MNDPQILFDVSDHIATITLNRPEAMNALAGDMRQVILRHLQDCAADTSVRCIVITGAVNGAAAGGGMNMALACDIRLGCEKTLFSESFVKIGLIPDWGGFGSLTELVGIAKAMELMMTGERIRAEEAYRLGLLNQLYPMDSFRDDVRAFAKILADGPPQALAAIKQGVFAAANASLSEVLDFERRNQTELFLADDAREGMRAFLEKRPPSFGPN
jgi:2-(1,2-epoxy-1,2-dihydrophenyl)acetyl-CoA isomerase